MTALRIKPQEDLVRRIAEFNTLLSNRTQDETPLINSAVSLINDLMSTCDSLQELEAVMKARRGKNAYDSRIMYNMIIYSMGSQHKSFDRLLSWLANDFNAKNPLILKGEQTRSMFPLFIHSTSQKVSEEQRPKLWNHDYTLSKNHEHFLLLHKKLAVEQLTRLFSTDYANLPKIISSLHNQSVSTQKALREMLMDLVSEAKLKLDDPIRLKIIQHQAPMEEIRRRIDHIFDSFKNTPGNVENLVRIDYCVALINHHQQPPGQPLNQCIDIALRRHKNALMDITSIDPFMQIMHFIGEFSSLGYDPINSLRALDFPLGSFEPARFFNQLVKSLPTQSMTGYITSRINLHDAWKVATLVIQDPDELTKLKLDSDTLITLHLLTGDERFRTKLLEPQHAESLLNHDLGL